jgi:hypothetical protein
MDLNKISAGRSPPKDIHAVIEIPLGGVPVKYEIDKASGALFVDRFLHTAMFYPGNSRLDVPRPAFAGIIAGRKARKRHAAALRHHHRHQPRTRP